MVFQRPAYLILRVGVQKACPSQCPAVCLVILAHTLVNELLKPTRRIAALVLKPLSEQRLAHDGRVQHCPYTPVPEMNENLD